MPARSSCRVAAKAAVIAAAALLTAAASADAQSRRSGDQFAARGDHPQRVAKLIELPSGNQSADALLFPLIVAIDPVPDVLADTQSASMITGVSDDWEVVEKWAMAEPQRKALEALAKIGDTKIKYGITLPYDAKNVDPAWAKAGLAITPGPSGLLADVKFDYLRALEPLMALVNVEATRLAEAGEGGKALNMLQDLLRLGRVIADRPTINEKIAGMALMSAAAERMCDVAYTHPEAFKPQDLITAVQDLDERLVEIMRIRLPEYTRLAADQIVEKTMVERGEVDQGKLAAVLSRITSSGRPLTRFAEAARWRAVGERHAGWFDTKDQIEKVWGDYSARWELPDIHDAQHERPTDFARMDPQRFALVAAFMKGLEEMHQGRKRLLADMAGTRASLAVAAYKLDKRTLPPALQAVIPAYARREYLDDPYHIDTSAVLFQKRVLKQMEYFVPIRDQKFGPRELPRPHAITVLTEAPVGGAAADPVQQLVDSFVPGLAALASLPADAFDPAAGTLDAAKINAAMKAAVQAAPITEQDRAAAAMSRTMLKDQAADPAALRTLFESVLGALPPGVLDDIAQRLGLTPDELKTMAIDSGIASMESQASKDLMASDQPITDDQLRAMDEAAIDWLTQPDNVDTYLRKIVEAAAKNSPAESEANSFQALVDDKQFVLYSVGPDGRDQEARRVGKGGADILYWPPVLSLTREHLQASE